MFYTFPIIKTEHVSGADTGNIPLSYKTKTGKKTVIEDMEDDIYELPVSDFSKFVARLSYEIYYWKAGILQLSDFFT